MTGLSGVLRFTELSVQSATNRENAIFFVTERSVNFNGDLNMESKQLRMSVALYTVYRCKTKISDDRTGPYHGSDDGEKTLCNQSIDEGWFIVDNTFTGKITCKKCLDELAIRAKKF
jgi:hypothetical protein